MSKYTLESKPFPPLENSHHGTGAISGTFRVVLPASVTQDVKSQLKFDSRGYKIRVMSLEIATSDAPNWFGVAFREGLSSFDTVNIFCHPTPHIAGMEDPEYATRSGNWPRLFRYAEMLAGQIAMANANHITIIPFFTNSTYGSTGIFGPNWKDIVEQILALARSQASVAQPKDGSPLHVAETPVESAQYSSALRKKGAPTPPVDHDHSGRLKHVVLSDFSHGRKLMWAVRANSPGLRGFLREVWDFDGQHAPPPVNGIIYDAGSGAATGPKYFSVPPERWLEYHQKAGKHWEMHGDVPAMLAFHAATISSVG